MTKPNPVLSPEPDPVSHPTPMLGAYSLGALDEQEAPMVEAHLASCSSCRRELDDLRGIADALGTVPPEALLEGPPEAADLLLQRTLRQAGTERSREIGRRRTAGLAAAALTAAVALGGGVLLGRSTMPEQITAQPPPTAPSLEPGTRFASAGGNGVFTNARLTIAVRPARGWVRVNAAVAGVPAGQKCRLVVIARDGTRREAGSWIVSEMVAAKGVNLEGFALVDPKDVSAVEVVTFAGEKIATAALAV